MTYHISTPTSKTKILISLSIKCFGELVNYGAQAALEREYGALIVQTESGYDFSIEVDLENLPADQEGKDALIASISLLRRNAMAAPFHQAFEEYAAMSEESTKFTSESAPAGMAEGGQVKTIHYNDDEAIYIKASHDRVTVIFSTAFREETVRIFGKLFLQEFVDARRRAIQNAPQVLFRDEPPLELQGLKDGLPNVGAGELGYVTFGTTPTYSFALLLHCIADSAAVLFPRHLTAARREEVISHIMTFRDYFQYHIKAAKAYINTRMRRRTADFLQGIYTVSIVCLTPR